MFGKFFASSSFALVYMFTAELFPTTIRSSAVGICSLMARIGGISAPQIAIALPKVIIRSQLSGVLNSTHSPLKLLNKLWNLYIFKLILKEILKISNIYTENQIQGRVWSEGKRTFIFKIIHFYIYNLHNSLSRSWRLFV